MGSLLEEIHHNPMLRLLVFGSAVFAARSLRCGAHTLLFVLAVLAIASLATLASRRER